MIAPKPRCSCPSPGKDPKPRSCSELRLPHTGDRNAAVSRAGIIRPLSPSKGFSRIHQRRQVKSWLFYPLQGKALTSTEEFVRRVGETLLGSDSKCPRLRFCVSPGCFPALCPFRVCVSAALSRLGGSCWVLASPGRPSPCGSEGYSLWPWFWQQGLLAPASPIRQLSQLLQASEGWAGSKRPKPWLTFNFNDLI